MTTEVVVKKRLRIGILFIYLLVLYLIVQVGYLFFTMEIKSVKVIGNYYIEESEVIKSSDIKANTKNFLTLASSIEKNVEKLDFVKNATVTKSIFGNVEIDIEERSILFYDNINSEYVLEDGVRVKSDRIIGVPTLVNYTPENLLETLIEKLSLADQNLINKISEIEYAPNVKDSVVLDDERFIFKMNDTNTVHVNLYNFENFLKYEEAVEKLNERGTLFLDSSNDGHIFEMYKEDETKLPS